MNQHQIEGRFLGFIPKPGNEFKYMQVQIAQRTIAIKLAKELRAILGKQLVQGDRLSIFLEPTKGKKLKLKSDRIIIHDSQDRSILFTSESTSTSPIKPSKQKGKILLCSKSSCSKRGGKRLYSALKETLTHLGLQDEVKIQLTGCQKQCKKAPSIILMPGKAKYTHVHPQQLNSLLKTHFLVEEAQSNKFTNDKL